MSAGAVEEPGYARSRGRLHSSAALAWVHTVSPALPSALVICGAALGFAWMSTLLLKRANGLATPAYDLAFFQQVVWNASRGNGFISSFSQGSFLGLHLSPLLVLPAALERIWPDARLLSVVHALGLAAAGPAAYLFLRAAFSPARAGPWLAAALAAPLPLWSAIQEAGRADFHTEALALPLALLAGWAGLRGRVLLLWVLAIATLLAKEDQGYTLLVLGALLAVRAPGRLWRGGVPWRRGHPAFGPRISGLSVSLLGLAWTPLAFGLIMPWLRGDARLETDWYYGWLFSGGVLAHLDRIVGQLTNLDGWLAAAGIMVTLALLPLLRPLWTLLALPLIVVNLLSANPAQADMKLHYTLLPLLPLIVATALGGRRLLLWRIRWMRRTAGAAQTVPTFPRTLLRRRTLLALALPALAVAWLGGGMPPTLRTERGQWDRPAARTELLRVAAAVPADAVLVVDDGLAAPLASRSQLRILPNHEEATWILIDRAAILPGYSSPEQRDTLIRALPRSGRPLVVDDGRFELWGPSD